MGITDYTEVKYIMTVQKTGGRNGCFLMYTIIERFRLVKYVLLILEQPLKNNQDEETINQ